MIKIVGSLKLPQTRRDMRGPCAIRVNCWRVKGPPNLGWPGSDVCCWHICDMQRFTELVRNRTQSGHETLPLKEASMITDPSSPERLCPLQVPDTRLPC